MNVELITPEKKLFNGTASRIQMPGIDGLFEVLNDHAPLISALKEGQVKITTKEGLKLIKITGGFAEVLKNKVVVLAESATAI